MHIPDGFLHLQSAGAGAAISAAGVWAALRRLGSAMPRRKVPLMGLSAAFLFTAQMLNFPVAAGTSGHLLGAVLASVLLGPAAAVVVMTAVLVVQCLLFADGGVLALGANVLTMALVAVLGGHAVFAGLSRLLPSPRGLIAAAAFASWCSIVLAAACCAVLLAWAGLAPFGLVLPAMAGVHMVIGLGEGLITALVLVAIRRTRPELLDGAAPHSAEALRDRPALAFGAIATLAALVFGVPFASPLPDGLEHVAEALGFAGRAASDPRLPAPLPDYRLPGIGSPVAATLAAGLIGTLVAFALAWALARALVPRPGRAPAGASGA
jgi:cobalt/nickel transport system permease protein